MAKTPEEKISALEKVLLRDLKLMRHRQVIHPVLQEGRLLLTGPPPHLHLLLLHTLSLSVFKVGLKLNLLDPTLAIDLRYLGVRLPIPPPGEAPPLGQAPGIAPHSPLRISRSSSGSADLHCFSFISTCRSVLRLCIPNGQNHRRDSDQRLEGKIHGTRNSARFGTTQY